MIENRLIDIGLKITSHDDTLDALNKLVYRQQRKIDELEALCAELGTRLRDMRERTNGGESAPADERPPHY